MKTAIAAALFALLLTSAPALAAPPRPKTGKSFVVERSKGAVFVTRRGAKRRVRVGGRPLSIPAGSTVDATKGTVELTSTHDRAGRRLQSAVFYDGAFVVHQDRSSKPVTELELAGGTFSGCGAERRRTGVFATRSARRRLWGSGKGRFRTRGRNGSATVRGTTWLTEDECGGTSTLNRNGKVIAEAQGVALERVLDPGQSAIFHCNTAGVAGLSRLYCLVVLSQPASTERDQPYDVVGLGIATTGTAQDTYTLCVDRSGAAGECGDFPFGPADADGVKTGGVGCVPSVAGSYSAQWGIGGQALPVPLPFAIRTPYQEQPFCVSDPPRPGIDPPASSSRAARQTHAAARPDA